MSDMKKEERETPPKKTPKDHHHHQQHDHEQSIDDQQHSSLFIYTTSSYIPPPFDFEQVNTSSTSSIKRPRYTSSAPPPLHQWKQQPPQLGLQSPQLSPTHSNPLAQTQAQAQTMTSPDTPSSSSAQDQPQQQQHHHQFRKGKYVSPVWKPHEMLWLAKAWRAQYQGDGVAEAAAGGGGGGRGKTRAEKDKEVAEYLTRHGINRDAKTAGTKWDNMLGEFRKVYEWERGGEREQVGKSYFRLSPYERKIHRLPASFDEQVFEELSQFMGPKMRPSSITSSTSLITTSPGVVPHHHHFLKTLPPPPPPPPPPPFRDDDYPLSSVLSARTRQMEQYTMRNTRNNPLLGYESRPHHHPLLLDFGPPSLFPPMAGTRAELRRIGRMRMTWEESVSLWAEEGEFHRGRVKVSGSSLMNADELVYFDEAMVASTLEGFEDGPLKGFSVDRFVPGQQLKVFGRKKSTPSLSLPLTALSPGEFQDPTDYHLGCLRVLPGTLPSLFELSWYIQEPPPEELRMPLRKDIYRDLPQGRELFFTPSSELLDCKSFTIDILSSIVRSNPSISASTSTSRDSYISLWDDCVNRVVSKFCPIEVSFIRKQHMANSSSESLQDQWPNLTGMVKSLCLWRGEEVDRIRESQPLDDDPSSTITSKISWTYGDLPYVLGYYAVGHNVTFCALSPSMTPKSSSSSTSTSQKPEITRTDLYSVDLSNPSERLKSLVPCWRIGLLLASLAEKCSTLCHSDFERRDPGVGNVIEMTPNTVTKIFPSKREWQKVKEIYDMLDQRVPHAEHISSYDKIELSLVFKPRGINSKPKNCEQLVLALKQVTKALVALHDLSFMHRDLSWDKVMLRATSNTAKVEEEAGWFVAGFDEGVGAPQINPRVAVEGSGMHAPEMARGVHGVKVDVWGVGYLVKTSGVQISKTEESVIGKQLRELEVRCMEQNPEQRPTAADCYHHLLQIQSSLSSAVAGGC